MNPLCEHMAKDLAEDAPGGLAPLVERIRARCGPALRAVVLYGSTRRNADTSDGLVDAYTGAPQLHEAYEEAEDTDPVAEEILEKSVTDDEIRDVVLGADSLASAADRFVDLSNERGGKDNVSVVLFRDETLPDGPAGSLPLREYDPDPERVLDWDTVKQVSDDRPEQVDPVEDESRTDDPDS